MAAIIIAALVIIAFMVFFTLRDTKDESEFLKQQEEKEPEVAESASETAKAETPVKAEKAEEKEAPKKKTVRKKAERPRFYAISNMRDLRALAKNSAAGADDCANEIKELEEKLKGEKDRKEKTRIKARISYLESLGRTLEDGADTYAYLIEKVTKEQVDFRKTERFAEKAVDVSAEDIRWIRKRLS